MRATTLVMTVIAVAVASSFMGCTDPSETDNGTADAASEAVLEEESPPPGPPQTNWVKFRAVRYGYDGYPTFCKHDQKVYEPGPIYLEWAKVPDYIADEYRELREEFAETALQQLLRKETLDPETCHREYKQRKDELQAANCKHFCSGACELQEIVRRRGKLRDTIHQEDRPSEISYAGWFLMLEGYVSADIKTPVPWDKLKLSRGKKRELTMLQEKFERRCFDWQFNANHQNFVRLTATIAEASMVMFNGLPEARRLALREVWKLGDRIKFPWASPEGSWIKTCTEKDMGTGPEVGLNFLLSHALRRPAEFPPWTCPGHSGRFLETDSCGRPGQWAFNRGKVDLSSMLLKFSRKK